MYVCVQICLDASRRKFGKKLCQRYRQITQLGLGVDCSFLSLFILYSSLLEFFTLRIYSCCILFKKQYIEEQPCCYCAELHKVVSCGGSPQPPSSPTAVAPPPTPRPYHQQGEHGLAHVEAMPPVVVGDLPVALAQGIHEPHQGLWTHTRQWGSTHWTGALGPASQTGSRELGIDAVTQCKQFANC